MPWPKVPASTVSLMDAPRPHTTNEQPLRESDRSETKAKQTSRGRLVVYIYVQKIPPPEASDRHARDAPPSVVTDLAARSRSPLEVHRRPSSSSRSIPPDRLGLTLYTICHFASFRMDRSGKWWANSKAYRRACVLAKRILHYCHIYFGNPSIREDCVDFDTDRTTIQNI
jgi:hypothetical protein